MPVARQRARTALLCQACSTPILSSSSLPRALASCVVFGAGFDSLAAINSTKSRPLATSPSTMSSWWSMRAARITGAAGAADRTLPFPLRCCGRRLRVVASIRETRCNTPKNLSFQCSPTTAARQCTRVVYVLYWRWATLPREPPEPGVRTRLDAGCRTARWSGCSGTCSPSPGRGPGSAAAASRRAPPS